MDRALRPAWLSAVLLSCAALVVPAGAASASGCADQRLIPDASNGAQIRAATHCLVNSERARAGRRPLAISAALRVPAQRYAQQMVRQGFFDHVCPAGTTILTRVKSLSTYLSRRTARYALGENLGWGSSHRATPIAIVRSWMSSPGHRRNILERGFRDIGIGVAQGAPEDVGDSPAGTYVTVFGQRSAR